MAIRYSDAAARLITDEIGLRRALNGCHIVFFTGNQPSSANADAGSSQPIISFTLDDGVYTAEKRPTWQFTLSAILAETTISSVTVGGIELLSGDVVDSSLNGLCGSLVDNINSNIGNLNFEAKHNAGIVTISGPIGIGPRMNDFKVAVGVTGTITIAYDDSGHDGSVYSSGSDSQNGLSFSAAKDGANLTPAEDVFYIENLSSENWKGINGFGPATAPASSVYSGIVNGQTYTAGWGRICSTEGDDGLSTATDENGYVRVDFSVAASNADCTMLPAPSFYVSTASGQEIESVLTKLVLKLKKRMG